MGKQQTSCPAGYTLINGECIKDVDAIAVATSTKSKKKK